MTNFTINSRAHGQISFFMPNGGGYVRLESSGKPGTLGKQLCAGGDFMGSTISATPETFERACRRWHKQRLAAIREFGMEYGN